MSLRLAATLVLMLDGFTFCSRFAFSAAKFSLRIRFTGFRYSLVANLKKGLNY